MSDIQDSISKLAVITAIIVLVMLASFRAGREVSVIKLRSSCEIERLNTLKPGWYETKERDQ
jgi:hypothetical protein